MIADKQQFILDRAISILSEQSNFDNLPLDIPGHSERIIEVPWAAKHLAAATNILDIGFAMSSLDWLGLLLAVQQRNKTNLVAADIVRPERVASRYPDAWREQVLSVPVTIGDIRTCDLPAEHFDLVTCISTIEHIGFDEASIDDPNSAFKRGKTPAEIAANRHPNTNRDVLDAFHRVLQTNGRAMISVPMGRGGATLLKDSLGLYTRQWEYEQKSWNELTSHPGFSVLEQQFFALGADDCWQQVASPADLVGLSSELQPHASGCAVLLLQKR
ncbi:MAG: class I SAM-dependent methyltransferase [Robiginitomaculum sp.]|nr:class I SAM-dependent methyltransferase [Robiginitomaculum sp.]